MGLRKPKERVKFGLLLGVADTNSNQLYYWCPQHQVTTNVFYIQTYKKHLNVLTRLQNKSRLPFSIPKLHDGDYVTQEKFNPIDQPQGKLQMPLVDAEADMQAERLPPSKL